MIVLDASAIIELLLATAEGAAVARRIGDEPIAAPHLIDVEIAQVMRRFVRGGRLDAARGRDLLIDLADLDLLRYEHTVLLPRIFALRGHLTAYDAAYVALAEVLDAPLLTFDERIANAPNHDIDVIVPTR